MKLLLRLTFLALAAQIAAGTAHAAHQAASRPSSAAHPRMVDQPLPPHEGELLKGLLPDGLRCFIWFDPEMAAEEVCLFVGVGSSMDMEHKQGAAAMVSDLLLVGHSDGVAAADLARDWEVDGSPLVTSADEDGASYQLQLSPANLATGLGSFGRLISRCEARPEDFRAALERARARFRNQMPWSEADSSLRRALFQQYGYHRVPRGTPENFESITQEVVRGYYSQYYRPNNSVLMMAGPVPPEQARQIALKAFEPWQYGYIPPGNPNPPPTLDHEVRESAPGIEGVTAVLAGTILPHQPTAENVALRIWAQTLVERGDSLQPVARRAASFTRHKLCDELRVGWTPAEFDLDASLKEWRGGDRDSVVLQDPEAFARARDAVAQALLEPGFWTLEAARAASFGWQVETPEDLRRALAQVSAEQVAEVARHWLPEDRWALIVGPSSPLPARFKDFIR